MKYSIIQYSECDKELWKNFVEKNDEAWFWHNPIFFEAWPYGQNCSFCIMDEKKEIVLLQALFINHSKTHWRVQKFHGIPYVRKIQGGSSLMSIGGMARKNELTSKQERNIIRTYIEYMDGLINKQDIKDFTYSIQATLSKRYFPQACPLVNPIIYFGYKNTMRQSYIIDLSEDMDKIFRNYSQTTRNLIYRCQKDEKINIIEAQPTEEHLNIYYGMHEETYRRTGVTPHPRSYFEHIFFDILKEHYCHILFCFKDGKPIAAHNTLLYKDAAMYWTGCSVSEKGDGESRLLMHEQITYAKNMGIKFFEVGEAFPNVREGKMKGLNDFKKSFGGHIHPLFSGEYLIQH